jgi:hypothetical protein
MKKIGFLFLGLLSICCNAQNISSVFGNMPKEINLLADSIQRQDLLDLYKNNVSANIKDKLTGKITLNTLNEDFMELNSGNSSMQIALLRLVNDSKVVLMIQTVCAPVCDSRLSFYTTDWKPLDTSDFILPANASWFINNDTDKTGEDFINASKSLDMDLMLFRFDPEKLELIQSYTTPQYLGKEDREVIKPFLKQEPKIFIWRKIGFK